MGQPRQDSLWICGTRNNFELTGETNDPFRYAQRHPMLLYGRFGGNRLSLCSRVAGFADVDLAVGSSFWG